MTAATNPQQRIPIALILVWIVFLSAVVSAIWVLPSINAVMLRIPDVLIVASGSIIIWRTEQKKIGWVLVILGVLFTLAYLLDTAGAQLGIEWMGRAAGASIGSLALFAYLILIFPQGSLFTKLSRIVVTLVAGLGVAQGAYLWFTYPNAAALDAGILFFAAMMPVLVGIQVAYLKHRTPVERRQVKWFLYAIAVAALVYIVAILSGVSDEQFWIYDAVATSLWPIAILIAITKYHLYDIDRIVSRSVTYLLLVGILAAVFFGLVAGITTLLPTQNSLAVAAATLGVAALFNPLRIRVQGVIDRRFNRDRYDAQQIVARFTDDLRAEAEMENLAHELTGVVEETLQPAAIGVWIREA